MDFSGLISTALAVSTVAAVGVVGLVLGTVRTLRESNADLRLRVTDLETGRASDKAEIATLKADRDALARTVTGEAHWVAITETLNEHHAESMKAWQRESAQLSEIQATLSKGDDA